MLGVVFKGISATIAVVVAALSIGLSLLSAPEPSAEVMLTPPPDDAPKEDHVTVQILQSCEETGFLLQQACDLYSINQPRDIRFSIRTVGNESDYASALRASLLSGDGVDLFHISGARELYELQNNVRALDYLPWVKNACGGTLDAVTVDGQVFGVPYSIEGFGLICNRDIFEKAGIQLVDIQSFDSLTKAFNDLKEAISSGELSEDFPDLEAVCAFPAKDKDFLRGGFLDIVASGSYNSPAEAALAKTINFPASEPAEALLKLIARNSPESRDWSKLAEVTDSVQTERLARERVAVIMQDMNIYKRVNELNPNLRGRLFMLPIPLDTYEQPSVYLGAPAYWAVNADCDEKTADAAGGFLTWLYQTQDGAGWLAEKFEAVSPYRESAKSTGVSLHSQTLSCMEAGMTMPQLHRDFPRSWGKDIFAPNVQSYFTEREKTWEQVIQNSVEGFISD